MSRKTDIPRVRAFGIRLAEAYIHEVEPRFQGGIVLPGRSYSVDQKPTVLHGRQVVDVQIRCSNGGRVELSALVDTDVLGKLSSPRACLNLLIPGGTFCYNAEAAENESGQITISKVEEAGQQTHW